MAKKTKETKEKEEPKMEEAKKAETLEFPPIVEVEEKEEPKKDAVKATKPGKETTHVKLLVKHPDEDGNYIVRDVAGRVTEDGKKVRYRVHKSHFDFSFVPQEVELNKLEEIVV